MNKLKWASKITSKIQWPIDDRRLYREVRDSSLSKDIEMCFYFRTKPGVSRMKRGAYK